MEGHNVFEPANAQQLRADYLEVIGAGFAATPSEPTDPPEQWTVLDFLPPATLRPDAPRWSGRFGEDGPDAMVALDEERAVYSWKDPNSHGYGEGPITHRGAAPYVEPYPGVPLLLEPLAGNVFQATYVWRGRPFVTRLHPVRQ